VLLKMQDTDKKQCHFVGDKGCSVYEDRPWACRMYPLGMASPKEAGATPAMTDFFFLLEEEVCKGFQEEQEQNVAEWIADQGIADYNEIGELWKELTLHPYFQSEEGMVPSKIEMFFMVCYNLDKFRAFVFDSSFLSKFEFDQTAVDKMKDDDIELLKFGYQWLRFALFNEPTMKVNTDILETKRAELEAKKKI
jgi:hypothetical protein